MSLVSGKKPAIDEPLRALQCKGMELVFSHLFHDVARLGVSVVDVDGCVFRKALFDLEDGVVAPPTFQANHTYPDLHPSFVRKLAFPLTLFSTFLRHGGVRLLAGY